MMMGETWIRGCDEYIMVDYNLDLFVHSVTSFCLHVKFSGRNFLEITEFHIRCPYFVVMDAQPALVVGQDWQDAVT